MPDKKFGRCTKERREFRLSCLANYVGINGQDQTTMPPSVFISSPSGQRRFTGVARKKDSVGRRVLRVRYRRV